MWNNWRFHCFPLRPAQADASHGRAGLEKIRRDHSPKLHYEALMQIYARVAALKTLAPSHLCSTTSLKNRLHRRTRRISRL